LLRGTVFMVAAAASVVALQVPAPGSGILSISPGQPTRVCLQPDSSEARYEKESKRAEVPRLGVRDYYILLAVRCCIHRRQTSPILRHYRDLFCREHRKWR
jgi:hypothetical protein